MAKAKDQRRPEPRGADLGDKRSGSLVGRLSLLIEQSARYWGASVERRVRLFSLISVLLIALFAAQWFRVEKTLAGAHRRLGRSAETVYVPPAPVLRMASLGHQSFMADLIFLRATQYFVHHLLTDSRLPELDTYVDAIWALDAHNRSTYRWAAQVVKFGQRIDRGVSKRANRFARLGLHHFPNDAWLYHEIAFNLYYHWDDNSPDAVPETPEEEDARKALSLRYLDKAYQLPGFHLDPNYLVHQYARAGRVEDSITAALANYADATEDQRYTLRQILLEKDKADTVGQLAWLDRLRRRDWPWLPGTLGLLLGPRLRLIPPPSALAHIPEAWAMERFASDKLLEELGLEPWTLTLGRPPAAGVELVAPPGALDHEPNPDAGLDPGQAFRIEKQLVRSGARDVPQPDERPDPFADPVALP